MLRYSKLSDILSYTQIYKLYSDEVRYAYIELVIIK